MLNKKILKYLYNSGKHHSRFITCNYENIHVKLMAGMQFALSSQYLAPGCASSCGFPDKLSVSFIYSVLLGTGTLCQALRQGDLGSKASSLANGKISYTFLGHGEKYEVICEPAQGLVPSAAGSRGHGARRHVWIQTVIYQRCDPDQSLHLQNMSLRLRSVVRIK